MIKITDKNISLNAALSANEPNTIIRVQADKSGKGLDGVSYKKGDWLWEVDDLEAFNELLGSPAHEDYT